MDWTKTTWGLLVTAWTAAMLVFAAVLEHGFDMAPCALCLMQRFWFVVAGLVALGGIAHNPRLGIYPLVTIVAALVGGGFSLRQLWVESLPPGEAPACGAGIEYLIDAGMANEALTANDVRHRRLRGDATVPGALSRGVGAVGLRGRGCRGRHAVARAGGLTRPRHAYPVSSFQASTADLSSGKYPSKSSIRAGSSTPTSPSSFGATCAWRRRSSTYSMAR